MADKGAIEKCKTNASSGAITSLHLYVFVLFCMCVYVCVCVHVQQFFTPVVVTSTAAGLNLLARIMLVVDVIVTRASLPFGLLVTVVECCCALIMGICVPMRNGEHFAGMRPFMLCLTNTIPLHLALDPREQTPCERQAGH